MRTPRSAFLSLFALWLSPASPAQENAFAWPETRAGIIARAWFDALEKGTDEASAAFERAHRAASELARRSVEERVKSAAQRRAQFAGLRPQRVLESQDLALVLVARAAAEDAPAYRLAFTLEPAEPHKLVVLEIRPFDPDEPSLGTYEQWKDLADLLTQVRRDAKLPAIAAALVRGAEIVDAAAVGVRAEGSEEPIALGDRFHVGSVTKSMTATMIAKLVEEGVFGWDLTVAEALPAIEKNDAYGPATMAQLLRHRAGLQPHTAMNPLVMAAVGAHAGKPMQQRAAFLELVLNEKPAGKLGEHFEYSNAGYTLAAGMAEARAKSSWEELMQKKLFAPLALQSAIIGWPADKGREAAPRGHFAERGKRRVQSFGEYDLGGHIGPAGDVACSIEDFARFARFHLQGLKGQDGFLRAETVRTLHQAADGGGLRYAAGWVLQEREGAEVHWHNGSAGTFFAQIELEPTSDLAVVVATNAGDGRAACEKVAEVVRRKFRGK
ncbi:MAG: beta-lactamase family protein [Planctomycetes bacterium]|nr:beta-lactamase family protein [Planctomycetota bacterium]